jgi:hypothetical protein
LAQFIPTIEFGQVQQQVIAAFAEVFQVQFVQ